MQKTPAIAAVIALSWLAACASAGPEANRTLFQREVGFATPTTARALTLQVFNRYGFTVEREQPIPNIVIQTHWKERTPFNDEQTLGINRAQNRMVMTARPRNTTSNAEIYAVGLKIENRVQLVGSDSWTDASATRQYEQWADRIVGDFTREINVVGVRR